MINTMSNAQLLEEYDAHIKGHETAKKVLINLVNRSKLRHHQKHQLMFSKDDIVDPLSCLLIGQSGTGKTYLVETLAKICHFPLIKFDATALTSTSAKSGIEVKDVIKTLHTFAKDTLHHQTSEQIYYSPEGVLDQTVVFIDEIDKLAINLGHDWNKNIQANFLALFENKTELTGLSFVFAGAFSGLDRCMGTTKHIGFGPVPAVSNKDNDLTEAIIKFGLMPELVGRINNIVSLDNLTLNDYIDILIKHILPAQSKCLKSYNIDVDLLTVIDPTKIAQEALDSGLGIRALVQEVNKIMLDVEFNNNFQPHNVFLGYTP